jgi:general secretion pathway protein K
MQKIMTDKGIALLMVIWILVLLSVIVGEFCFTMRTQVNITRNVKETTEAHYIAKAGVNAAIEQLIQQMVIPSAAQAAAEEDSAKDLESEDGEEEEVQWRINTQIPSRPYGKGEYRVWIDNEGGKVNINLADKAILRAMLDGFAIEDTEKETIVDSILDWRDANDLHLINGAEDDYYLALPNPYECKDDYFDSIEELLLVRGVTPEIYYGGLEQMVTVVPSEKIPSIRGDTHKKGKKKKDQFDYNKLNMNAIPPGLWAMLPGMTQEALDQIIEFRKTQNFRSPMELSEIVGPEVYAGIARYLTLRQTPYFTIRSIGTIKDSRIAEGIEAVVCVSSRLEKKYQVLQWKEGVPPIKHQMALPGTQQESAVNG